MIESSGENQGFCSDLTYWFRNIPKMTVHNAFIKPNKKCHNTSFQENVHEINDMAHVYLFKIYTRVRMKSIQ